MNKDIKTQLIECRILMSEAIRGYEDKAFQSNKLFDIRQYRNKLPEDTYKKIESFVNENIRPMVYDSDYWAFIEKDEQYGSCDENNHFIVDSDRSLECIIFRKFHHVCDLHEKLNAFMLKEFRLDYSC